MRQLGRWVIAFTLLLQFLHGESSQQGTLSAYVLYDGKPLADNEVIVDSRQTYRTDSDGAVKIKLPVGKHQVMIYAKTSGKKNLGYVKRSVTVKSGRDTQLVASYLPEHAKPDMEIDTPTGKLLEQAGKKKEVKGKGVLRGVVLDAQSKQPVGGARVFVKGTAVDVRTDANGRFSTEVPAGIPLSFSVVHSAYSAATVNGVKVPVGGAVNRRVTLTPASMELEEFVVLAPKVEGSLSDVMQEEKKINAIANILGSEELSKKGDSSAAGALKRVSGITLVGNTVYIRGLGDRYSSVEMNSLPLPSPDPLKRTVPLDIFPSGVIKSIKVQKSATADIPASFGGGYIDIRTKESTSRNYLKATIGLKGNSNTGKSVYSYEGSSTDWLGKDDGYRAIPADILNASTVRVGEVLNSFAESYGYSREELEHFMKEIVARELKPKKKSLPLGGKVGLEGAYHTEIVPDHTLSVFGNYTYEQDHQYREEHYAQYLYNQQEDRLYSDPEQYGTIYRTTESYVHTGIFNLMYSYADVLHLKLTKLYTLNSESVMRVADGIANSDDDWKIRYNLDWNERLMDVNQISGDMKYQLFGYDNLLMFGAEWANANLNQPGNYKYAYLRDISFDGVERGDPYLDRFSPNIFLNQTSDDDESAFYLKNKMTLDLLSESDQIEVGVSHDTKERTYRYNKYQIDQAGGPKLTDDIDTIYDNNVRNQYTGLFSVNVAFRPAYWYDAEVNKDAMFAQMLVKPIEGLDVNFGVRYIDFSQTVYEYTNHGDVLKPIEREAHTLAFSKALPSFSMKYKINDESQVDAAYSQTYIVPDLREFSSAEFFSPYDVATIKGNPNLKNTIIHTYDLKYSYFFSDTEGVKTGLFYKLLEDPIEDVLLRSSSLPRYSFDNAQEATIYGIEIDGRKNLGFVSSWLKSIYLSGNFTYANSDVTLRKEQEALYTTNHRQLQGLSQTIVNLALSYETPQRSLTLSYNKMGERIRKVGLIDARDKYPDYYEVPPHLLDLVWIENFSDDLKLKVKMKNLLDDETIWYQGSKRNVTNRFKIGRSFSIEASYRF
jgi:outer membrane receptor protein involved in Fe transport